MEKLQLTGQNLGRLFNFRNGHLHAAHLWHYRPKRPSLKLKARPKQPLVSVLLDVTIPDLAQLSVTNACLV